MSEKNGIDRFMEYINNHILPFIDYGSLQVSYDTDMVYAKGVLRGAAAPASLHLRLCRGNRRRGARGTG